MIHIEQSTEINVPVDLAWSRMARLDEIASWADSVLEAHYHTDRTAGVGAGRTCEVRGLGTLVEEAVEWHEGHSFVLDVQGLPSIVAQMRGGWRFEALGPNRTRATITMDVTTRFGPLGALLGRVVLARKLGAGAKQTIAEYRDYVESLAQRRDASAA